MDNIIRVPVCDKQVYWEGQYSMCKVKGPIELFISNYIQHYYKNSRVFFYHTDGVAKTDDPLTLNSFSFIKGKDEIIAFTESPFPVIIPLLCTRSVSHPSFILTPLDDETFEKGLSYLLRPYQMNWSDKKPIVFWRGGASGFETPCLRLRVTDALYNVPSTDVRISRCGWEIHKNIPEEFLTDRCVISEYFGYKYILIIDGNMIASNHQWVFGSGSVPIMITHPDNDYWFKRYLVEGYHYVGISYDLSDLKEKIEWLVSHDNEAEKIARNAMEFANTIFSSSFQQTYIQNEIERCVDEHNLSTNHVK